MSSESRMSRIAVLLFTDMVDSVGMEKRIGTEAYSALLRQHHLLFLEALKEVGAGKIQYDSGDGFLAEFGTAAEAVNAALLFQMFLRETAWAQEAPKVRIGLHQGQLAEMRIDPASAGKIVGIPVSMANRVMSQARPGQILMTRAVYEDAKQFVREHPLPAGSHKKRPGLNWKAHGTYLFKGNEEPVEVFEIGASGAAPLTAPGNTEKAYRAGSVPTQQTVTIKPVMRPRIGAGITMLCGLALWLSPITESWVNSSYDFLFRFGSHAVTNKLAVIYLDNDFYQKKDQRRGVPIDRKLHTELLNKLASDGCPLVVYDVLFMDSTNSKTDKDLAESMRRQKQLVLAGNAIKIILPDKSIAVQPTPPCEPFLTAAHGNWGAAKLEADVKDSIVRRHWPFPSVDVCESLSVAAARLAGVKVESHSDERWLRYYGSAGAWSSIGYLTAVNSPTGYFKDTTVFVGSKPQNDEIRPEEDKFQTPYEPVGGVDLHATSFLNLVNGDWLRRLPWSLELLLLLIAGAGIGAGLVFLRPWIMIACAGGLALGVTIGAVMLTHVSNYWFPWLVIVGGQIPCGLIWALASLRAVASPVVESAMPRPAEAMGSAGANQQTERDVPEIPEYELVHPPIGEGAFGTIWLARSAIGQWQALKIVKRSRFQEDFQFNTEFEGIKKYKPVSEKHPGLLRVELVSAKKPGGYFYYVMELADSLRPGWQEKPNLYKPRTLANVLDQSDGRLPIPFCVQIGATLADALEVLHQNKLTHRDIKPANVIFVQGMAKLADVGLVTNVRDLDSDATRVGTPGYMPPPPEPQGTVRADIYGLGMLLYVISTGRQPDLFPQLSTTLLEKTGCEDFMKLDSVIIRACQMKPEDRYCSAAEMAKALRDLHKAPAMAEPK